MLSLSKVCGVLVVLLLVAPVQAQEWEFEETTTEFGEKSADATIYGTDNGVWMFWLTRRAEVHDKTVRCMMTFSFVRSCGSTSIDN